jgi:hypothetical protein
MAAFFISVAKKMRAVTVQSADEHSGKKSREEVERTGETRSYS